MQAPLRPCAYGYDSCDQVLDIVIRPDGTWRWKDESEFEEAVRLGIFSPEEAVEIRGEGERVIAQLDRLLPTGWEDWRPAPDWSADSLRLHQDIRTAEPF